MKLFDQIYNETTIHNFDKYNILVKPTAVDT